MSVGSGYEILVSRQAKKDPNIPGPIMTFADRPIFRRPSADIYWPARKISPGTGKRCSNDPTNPKYEPILLTEGQVSVLGVAVGLIKICQIEGPIYEMI